MTNTQDDMELTSEEAASILNVLEKEVDDNFDVVRSRSSSKRSTPTESTTPATKRQRTIPLKPGRTKRRTEEKKEEKQKEKEVVYVSVVAIPKASKKTNEVRDMYREMVRYAVKVMEDRKERGCGVSKEEGELVRKWSRLDKALELSSLHGGELEWEVQREGVQEKQDNKTLRRKLTEAREEIKVWAEKAAEQGVEIRVNEEVKKQVDGYTDKTEEGMRNELEKLREENGELKRKIGELSKELELSKVSIDSLVDKVRKHSRRRRGPKKKERREEEEEEGLARRALVGSKVTVEDE